ncbi:p53 and DNA damage-regulated protein 1-like [Mizuhopecten yessoensis]|uniref:p53 and DNA damage-regulated protein 1 n=1 Tax=Mizuhopecten yessoensis TaxID=6573 RepID=A0A210PUA8_MIZYE|nr:p53 and DNA damage-regulated protein 1-like [Mizuhopecten yessoensis]OWF40091.1 p53 and DNA damage-regulated protein 1 [Mizuhopecten yessoensis]
METEQLLYHLAEIEELAEDIISDKHQMVELDKKRQKTREAIRLLSKDKKSQKTWVCFGNMFIKLPKEDTKKLLEKDFNGLDTEIADVSKGLKPKVNKLRDLEHKEDVKGFGLNAMSRDEIQAVEALL